MANSMKELTEALLGLPTRERADLAMRLLESLDARGEEEESPDEIDALWMSEVMRRINEVESGETTCISGEQVMKEARARLGC